MTDHRFQHVPINRKSAKRKKEDVIYKKVCDEIDREAKEKDEWICYFCQFPLGERADHHHAKGRTGTLLTDKRFILLAHNPCHMLWHSVPHSHLVKYEWWDDFKKRLDTLLCNSL